MPLLIVPRLRVTIGDDDASFSFVSTSSNEVTEYTPSVTEQDNDEFELIDCDDEDSNEYSDGCTLYSDGTTSVSPSIYRHEYEHGRRYHSYKSGRYPLPNDLREQQVEDLKHQIMLELTEGHLFLSDIGSNPQRILDIGTGAGTWAIDVADLYPSASVIGTDLSPIQPSWLPVNIRMLIDDCEEDEWLHGSNFDLVHFRGVAGVLRNMDAMLSQVYEHLRTGGWVEFQDFLPEICCDDLTMQADDPLQTFGSLTVDGMRKFGCTNYGAVNLKESLKQAGFINIQCVTKKVPIAGWTKDTGLKAIGQLMKTVVTDSLGSYSAKPFAAMEVSIQARNALLSRVVKSMEDKKIHRYVKFCFCYAQKGPEMLLNL